MLGDGSRMTEAVGARAKRIFRQRRGVPAHQVARENARPDLGCHAGLPTGTFPTVATRGAASSGREPLGDRCG